MFHCMPILSQILSFGLFHWEISGMLSLFPLPFLKKGSSLNSTRSGSLSLSQKTFFWTSSIPTVCITHLVSSLGHVILLFIFWWQHSFGVWAVLFLISNSEYRAQWCVFNTTIGWQAQQASWTQVSFWKVSLAWE